MMKSASVSIPRKLSNWPAKLDPKRSSTSADERTTVSAPVLAFKSFQAASSGSDGASCGEFANVNPDAQPSDGLAMASAVRLALSAAGTAGPGTVRHDPVPGEPGGTANALAPRASTASAAALPGARPQARRGYQA